MGKNQDLESGINIPDPQYWFLGTFLRKLKSRSKTYFLQGEYRIFFNLDILKKE
jgi:hypothetical protein